MSIDRRGFLATALVLVGASLAPSRVFAKPAPPTIERRPIPRRMDLRQELHPDFADVEVRHHGVLRMDGVAYDLDEQTLTVLAKGLDGRVIPDMWMKYFGGVEVRWRMQP